MKNKLIEEIQQISQKESLIVSWDEASIKAGVILHLLSLLGWNPFDVKEIKPEYTVESKRVDFSLRIDEINKVFIEVKRPSESLDNHQEQLLGCSFREGVKLAILTNGLTWWFYLPLNEGSWESRRFYTADLQEQEPEAIATRFLNLLSKENVVSGDSLKNAESLYRSRKKKAILNETLPKAWHKLITDPDELLVELIIETTEKISGFRPEANEVEKFLKGVAPSTAVNPEVLPGKVVVLSKKLKVLSSKYKVKSNHSNINQPFEVNLTIAFIKWGGLSVKKIFRELLPANITKDQKYEFTIKFNGFGEVKAWMSQDRIKIPSKRFRAMMNILNLDENSKFTMKIVKLHEYYEASKS